MEGSGNMDEKSWYGIRTSSSGSYAQPTNENQLPIVSHRSLPKKTRSTHTSPLPLQPLRLQLLLQPPLPNQINPSPPLLQARQDVLPQIGRARTPAAEDLLEGSGETEGMKFCEVLGTGFGRVVGDEGDAFGEGTEVQECGGYIGRSVGEG